MTKDKKEPIKDTAEEIKKYYKSGDIEYIEDAISEYADSLVDVYASDLIEWAGTSNGFDYTEQAIDEFGWEGVGESLEKAYQSGQFIMYEEALRDELKDFIE